MDELDAIVSQRQAQVDERLPDENEMPLSLVLRSIKSNDPTLTEVLLDNRELAAMHEIEELFDALARNSIVKKVSLCNNGIDDSLAAALSLALVDNTCINEIFLSDNEITSEGCEYLLGTLDSNTTVSYIDLRGNLIDDRDMDEIDAINSSRANRRANQSPPTNSNDDSDKRDRTPVSLDSSNPPMHEVPEESGKELAKRKAIQSIMRDASISWAEKNQRIIELQQKYFVPKDENDPQAAYAVDNDDTGSVQALIDKVIDDERELVEIELDGQELGREDQKALFEALALNSHVTSLSVVNCRISNEGVAELMYALKQNSTLTHINLEDNQITSNTALDFISILKEHNKTLHYLELKDNRVRLGILSQINKLLEMRRRGISEPETMTAATVAATSHAQVAPVASKIPADAQSATSSRRSRSDGVSKASTDTTKSRGSKKSKSKSKSGGDRPRRSRKEKKTPSDMSDFR